MSALVARAKDIWQNEGLIALLRRGFAFIFYRMQLHRIYLNQTFYLYERTLEGANETNFIPRIQNLTFKIVSTNQRLRELSDDGFNLPINITQARHRLEKGAIAYLVFVGAEFAHIGWVAMTEEAKNTFNRHPYQVDFSNNEVCTGGVWTSPEFRRQGIFKYARHKRDQFLQEKGVRKTREIVETSNVASQRASAKYGVKKYAKARYVRIIRLQFWKEKPIGESSH